MDLVKHMVNTSSYGSNRTLMLVRAIKLAIIVIAVASSFMTIGVLMATDCDRKVNSESPPDSETLGRSAWTLIHTIASKYPDCPTQQDRVQMKEFLVSLSRYYPCPMCAAHLKAYLEKYEPDLTNRASLRQWLCHLHNNVNQRLAKQTFDCSRLPERWGGDLGHASDCPPESYR